MHIVDDSNNTNCEPVIDKLKRQQKENLQSLQYASYIQNALLPSNDLIDRSLGESFILHIPRDLVSGDFYWVFNNGAYLYVAVGDCTGHGVPGAIMSVLGLTFLDKIMVAEKQFVKPAIILNQLREHIMAALGQTGSEKEQKDGMDIGLCAFDLNEHQLWFSGAFHPLYLYRNGEIISFAGDNMPIGIAPFDERSFTNQCVSLQNNDMLYMFSDGYVDQFGGPEGKKFKFKPFRNLLKVASTLNCDQQKTLLYDEFNSWKQNNKQLDDVLVMGMRYSI